MSSDGAHKCSKLTADSPATASADEPEIRRDGETGTKLPHPVYTDRTFGGSKFKLFRTGCMSYSIGSSYVQRPPVSNLNYAVENLLQAESCSRWLKRLRCKPLDSLATCNRKSKEGVVTSTGEFCFFLSNELNWRANEHKKIMRSTRSSSKVSMEKLCSWIRRWCCKKTRKKQAQVRLARSVLYVPAISKFALGNYKGKQFPSLAAMALMGRVIEKFHTCVFHRRGCSVVWNIEGL